MTFVLHPRLAADCIILGDLPLCRLLLMNNQRFPWLILVPRRENLREIFDLAPPERQWLWEEANHIAEKLQRLTGAHKINVAALGNQVEQLHMHVIARFSHDDAWPNPVWNSGLPAMPYPVAESAALTEKLRAALNITKM